MRAGGFLFCPFPQMLHARTIMITISRRVRRPRRTVCLPPAYNYPVGANNVRPRTRLTITWAHTVRPYGMPTENEFTCVIFIWFRCLECCVAVYTVRRGRTPGHLLLPFGQFTLAHPTVSHNRYGFPIEPFGGMYAVVGSAQRQIPHLQSA